MQYDSDKVVDGVLAQYPDDCRPRRVETLGGAGGFSGAAFWRLDTERGTLCLRRWPPQADPKWPQRLRFIHALLEHVVYRGFFVVPAPIRTRQGETYVQQDDELWELTSWLPGHADYLPLRRPEKLRAALTALAEFHVAGADFATAERRAAPSPGIRRRRNQIDALRSGGLRAITVAVDAAPRPPIAIDSHNWSTLRKLARRLLPLYAQAEEPVLRELIAVGEEKIPLQPCIRDIWHDHVLFEGDRVSGIVDFGAMRIDNVAGDIARLLGSFSLSNSADDAVVWREGLAAYESVRPLSADERHLAGVFDRSGTLLAGINWLEWIFIEGRTFADLAAVCGRLGGIVARLEQLTQG
jgi:homoserine kinase type II